METGVCSNYGHKENLYCKCCIFPSVQLALVFFMLTREKKKTKKSSGINSESMKSHSNLPSQVLICKLSFCYINNNLL